MAQCPCGSGSDFEDCCGPLITGGIPAPTPEALMRSRFTAFVRGDLDHIKKTLVREERDKFDPSAARDMVETYKWISLEILSTSLGGEKDDTGTVNFAAHYKKDGAFQVHHEQSKFHREEGRWVYVDGDINPKGDPVRVDKVGRNQPCPCGSGKKFKKCCGA